MNKGGKFQEGIFIFTRVKGKLTEKQSGGEKETPLMKQYNAIKSKHPDALLLFRVGDFYETFGQDAVVASRILGIVLTRRANGSAAFVELAGFPHHSLDTYLPKLVRAGQRVAICDQLEDPKLAKTIVRRGITELVTPGVLVNDKILDHKSNNFLAALYWTTENQPVGVAFVDISTGEFLCAQGSRGYVDKLLRNFNPGEVLYAKPGIQFFKEQFGDGFYTFPLDEWVFSEEYGTGLLQKHFETKSLKGFGIDHLPLAMTAAGAVLHYLQETCHENLRHISTIKRVEEEQYLWLDRFTIRNLELVSSPHENGVTLLDVLDHTLSPMGARLLRRWMMLPLKEEEAIRARLDVVEFLFSNPETSLKLSQLLQEIGDLERLISKISLGRILPREIVQFRKALGCLEPIRKICMESGNARMIGFGNEIQLCTAALMRIEHEMLPDPAPMLGKGKVMADGISSELDELRNIAFSGKDYLLQLQRREGERTQIPSLKISYNSVFGYYLEVTNAHKDKVPADWVRKQTLTNAERYITEELKHYEEKIIGAEEKMLEIESKLFREMVAGLCEYLLPVQQTAHQIAQLDCLHSFSVAAKESDYVKPEINQTVCIQIINGRHPVIEKHLPQGEDFIPNDVMLDSESQQLMMITGPNMSGKSAILRQTALIVLMAQMGSFVPATAAKIGLTDKIFTRVGATDNISSGESTFMVEMDETASILNNLSPRSLILLDEIGRGTSTYDGISIAWAIAEFLHHHPFKPKTLFATHYHELNDMADSHSRIRNYHVSVKEIGNKVIFLRKLKTGGSEHSFGIHVAKMAGMPPSIVKRADEILKKLEEKHESESAAVSEKDTKDVQLSFFQLDDPLLEQIREEVLGVQIDTMTPVEALIQLSRIRDLLKSKKGKK